MSSTFPAEFYFSTLKMGGPYFHVGVPVSPMKMGLGGPHFHRVPKIFWHRRYLEMVNNISIDTPGNDTSETQSGICVEPTTQYGRDDVDK